jgi:hypothetical protein
MWDAHFRSAGSARGLARGTGPVSGSHTGGVARKGRVGGGGPRACQHFVLVCCSGKHAGMRE